MKIKPFLYSCLSAWMVLAGIPAYARDDVVYDPHAEEINQPAATQPSPEDLLRKQKLTTPQAVAPSSTEPSDEQLLANPREFERLFAAHLATGQRKYLARFSQLYQRVPDRDESLIEWAQAALLAQTNLNQSVRAYRTLSSKFPENDFIRFQMASVLFYNQEFDAAKAQFEKLRASTKVNRQDIAVFDQYLQAIANKEKWNFSLGVQFLHDKNLTGVAKRGTEMRLANGASLTQNDEPEKGTGLRWNASADKQWALDKGRFIGVETALNHKYYWNNKKFNELNAQAGLSYGYADARLDLKATPYLAKQWYGGGQNGGNRLRSYNHTYGLSLSASYWLTPSLKLMNYYNYGYEKYRNASHSKRYNGPTHSLSHSVLYLNGPKQYFGGGVDFTRSNVKEKSSAYKRLGARLFWGQEWPLGLSTRTGVGVAKRHYDAELLGIAKRRNTEYNANLSLWHKAVHFGGFTPRLTVNYQKIKSNFPLWSYDKKQAFIEVEKTF